MAGALEATAAANIQEEDRALVAALNRLAAQGPSNRYLQEVWDALTPEAQELLESWAPEMLS